MVVLKMLPVILAMFFIGLQFVLGWSPSNLRKGDFITITIWQLPQNKAPKLKTERNQAHMSTLLKSDIEAEHQCLWKEKIYTKPNIKCGVGCSFSGMRWHLLPTFNSMSAVKTAAGRMPSQFSVSLTSQRALRHSHWCVKKPAFFCILPCQFVICRRSLSFSRSFFNDPRASNEVSSHRRMRSLEIIMAGRPPWTWVLSNTKDGAEQWETFFLPVCDIQRIVIWHIFPLNIHLFLQYLNICMCVCDWFCLLCMQC